MLKIIAFQVREDEKDKFRKYAELHGCEIELRQEKLSLETAEYCRGRDAVIIQSRCVADAEVVKALSEYGCKIIASRAIGYENIDIAACREYGVRTANVSYSPASVAEFSVMLMLMLLRKMKQSFINYENRNPAIANLLGNEIHELCVGVVGYGNIGKKVIDILKGFGCEVLVYDYKPDKKFTAEYADLDTIYQRADIISLHIPYKENTYQMINRESISGMKDGVILINTSRGELIKTKDLIEALDNQKISACALDTFVDETAMFTRFREGEENYFSDLARRPNVILTSHLAFFTETATDDCIRVAFENISKFNKGEDVKYDLYRRLK